uniref:Uncharacterized protein n=1 Tax=Parascaris univalens TaxID=6257 RepID=A0A915CHM7_PARUN
NRTVFKASKRQTRDDDESSSRSSMDMQFDSKWTRDGTSPSYRRLHGSDSSLYSTASHRGSPHASDSRIRFPLQKTRTLKKSERTAAGRIFIGYANKVRNLFSLDFMDNFTY